MQVVQQSYPLQPLRKYVFKNLIFLIAFFSVISAIMMVALYLASAMTPKLIHLHYDSIAAANHMSRAWNALKRPGDYPEKPSSKWAEDFNRSLVFVQANLTEAGELPVVEKVKEFWGNYQKDATGLNEQTFKQLEVQLDKLIELNEKGMFELAAESHSMSKHVFIASWLLLLLSVPVALYLADNLAVKIAAPLRELAETLRRKPVPGSKLKLPKPTSLEMRIFIHELLMLWERLSQLRKLNLEEIFSQRKKFEAVLSSVDDAILVLDNQDRVIHCNPGMFNLIGVQPDQVIGHSWRDLSSISENYLKLRDLLKPDISSDQTCELIVVTTHGATVRTKKRIFSGRCRPFHGEQGEQIGSIYLLHDITEIRQRDRLKSEFIGVLSHELQTPLEAVGRASRQLYSRKNFIGEKVGEQEKQLVESVQEGVERIRAVANDFIQVGLVDLHSLRLKMERVSVGDLLQQWIQPFQVLAADKKIKLQTVKEGSEVIYAQVDLIQFPWAISNLISNAIRVSPPERAVIVYLTDRESRVDIEVRDEGPSIPEETQKKMFDPGYHEESGLGRFLGLGFSITKEVVEAHGGRMEYFNRSPQGSVFRISLPLP